MSAAKSIDWTRPLRTVIAHHDAHVVGIFPSAPLCVFLEVRPEAADLYKLAVDRRGCDEEGDIAVENVPPEPIIVERWAIVHPIGPPVGSRSVYQFDFELTRDTRAKAEEDLGTVKGPGRLIARLLIEEPGE